MMKGLFAALVVAGIALLIWGLRVYRSLGSELTEAVTGAPSDKAIWLLISGAIATVIGVFGLFSRNR